MLRTIQIGILLALVTSVASPQDAPGGARSLKKTLADLDDELRRIQQLLKELSRFSKSADAGSSTEKAEAALNLITAQEAFQRGRIAEERRQYETAIDAFSRAIQLDPRNESALLHRGRAYFELGNLGLALADLNQSLAVQPNSSRAYELRASVNRALKAYPQAVGDLQTAANLDPTNPAHVLSQAAIAEERGDTQAALELYARALVLNPGSLEIPLKRAAALRKGNRLEESLIDCTAAIELDPSGAAGYICRAESYVRLGRMQPAIGDLDQAMRLNPMALEAGPVISAVWRELQLRAVAQQLNTVTQQVAPQPPGNIQVPFAPNLVPTEPAGAPRPPAPAPAAEPAPVVPRPAVAAPDRTLSAKQAQYYTKKGRNRMAQERYQDAIADLTKAIELDPSCALAYNSRGYAYLRTREYTRAIADFTLAIRLNFEYANAYRNRGVARKLAGDAEGAKDDLHIAGVLAAQLQALPKPAKTK